MFEVSISLCARSLLIVRFRRPIRPGKDVRASFSPSQANKTNFPPSALDNVVFNGTKGRLQLSVVESTHRTPFSPSVMGGQIHGTTSAPNPGGVKVTLQRLWEEPVDLPVEVDHAAHGGGDTRMLNVLFGPKEGEAGDQGDAAKQRADERDGTLALAVGLAANLSFKTGRTVSVKDLDLGL